MGNKWIRLELTFGKAKAPYSEPVSLYVRLFYFGEYERKLTMKQLRKVAVALLLALVMVVSVVSTAFTLA